MESKFDPADWPPVRRCNDEFEQEGKASKKIADCVRGDADVELTLAIEAQADAEKKAALSCGHKCPAELLQWKANRKTCVENVLTVYVTGKFICKAKK